MDACDAILEQMQRAQKSALEAMTDRLNAVTLRLEESLNLAQSAVDGAIPESAEEVFPLGEIRSAVEDLRRTAGATAGASHSKGVLDAVARLEQKDSQSKLLKELLPILTDHAARSAVLVVRSESVMAWSGIGFADGEKLRSWQAQLSTSTTLSKFAEGMQPVRFSPSEDSVFGKWLEGEEPSQEALLVPVVLRKEISFVLLVTCRILLLL